jgi:hypothetical protein
MIRGNPPNPLSQGGKLHEDTGYTIYWCVRLFVV